MSVSLDQYRYFLMAAKLNHVGHAAKSLRISASAISGAISAIENEYSCSLFDRASRRIHLNEKGILLRNHLIQVFEKLDDAKSLLKENEEELSGLVTLGGSYFLVEEIVAPATTRLQEKNPKVRFEVIPSKTSQAIGDVVNGAVDYALCFSPHGHPELDSKLLYTGKLMPVISKKHPLIKHVKSGKFELSHLNDYSMIVHKSQPGTDYCENHPALAKAKVNAKVSQYYQSDALCVSALLDSESWALLPDLVLKRYRQSLFVLPVPHGFKAEYEVRSVFKRRFGRRRTLEVLNESFLDRVQSIAGV